MKTLLASVAIAAMVAGPVLLSATQVMADTTQNMSRQPDEVLPCGIITHYIADVQRARDNTIREVPPEQASTVYNLYQSTLDRLIRQLEVCK
jgi:hypothetical protein